MDKAGYIYYQLDKIYLAHRLVAQAFIDNPDNKPHVHHKNDIRHDSRADNLEWTTIQENLNYINRGLSQPELDKIQALLSLYKKNEVAKQLNIGLKTLYNYCTKYKLTGKPPKKEAVKIPKYFNELRRQRLYDIKERIKQGQNRHQIAQELGLSDKTIFNYSRITI